MPFSFAFRGSGGQHGLRIEAASLDTLYTMPAECVMAWLETKGNVYRIRFRFGGSKHLLPLETRSRNEAETVLSRFKATSG